MNERGEDRHWQYEGKGASKFVVRSLTTMHQCTSTERGFRYIRLPEDLGLFRTFFPNTTLSELDAGHWGEHGVYFRREERY